MLCEFDYMNAFLCIAHDCITNSGSGHTVQAVESCVLIQTVRAEKSSPLQHFTGYKSCTLHINLFTEFSRGIVLAHRASLSLGVAVPRRGEVTKRF